MDMNKHCREAAEVMADLLATSLTEAEEEGRHLYVWERNGIEWLRKQWKNDPGTMMNMWIADRYIKNAGLDLLGRMSTGS